MRLFCYASALATLWFTNSVNGQIFDKHVVVCQQEDAALAGREVLRAGGNAIDAAIATALGLAVTHPAAGNLGGGGFLVVYLADRKLVKTIDFREAAPLASTERMYLDDKGKILPKHRAGARAAGVPGTVAGLALAHKEFGKLPWGMVVAPAQKLAREGFVISSTLASSLNQQLGMGKEVGVDEDLGPDGEKLGDFASSVAVFKKPGGEVWNKGDRLVQPDLANTLDRIAAEGADGFYKGRTATLIADYMTKEGGLVTLEDLASYRAEIKSPLHGTFRNHDIYGAAPPSSGGVVILQALNILERFDLKADGPHSPVTLHRVTEAMRRAFHTRAASIGDPDFVQIPVERLISKPYAEFLARTIAPAFATPSVMLTSSTVEGAEPNHTTHLSTIDQEGSAVALTYTLEEGYGSKAVVAGAGFLLNNEMGDFNLTPGLTDATGRIGFEANRIVPRKRMLSSQSPTIVMKGGRVKLVTGSPGGRTIPNTTLWVILNVIEFELQPRASVDAARTHHQWFPDILKLEGKKWEVATVERLRQMGHVVKVGGIQGDAHSIVVDEQGKRHGVADQRRKTSTAAGD